MRKAPRAQKTSDVTRPRTLLLASAGAAVGVTIAVLAEGTPLATPRPIARPHAKNTCASCHGETANAPPPAAVCQTCHGSSHGSVRGGHQKMIAKGEMTCLTCHHQHAGAQGITFEDSKIVRWGAGGEASFPPPRQTGVVLGAVTKGTTVPLIPLSVCVKCHDVDRASDPIAACVPRGKGRAKSLPSSFFVTCTATSGVSGLNGTTASMRLKSSGGKNSRTARDTSWSNPAGASSKPTGGRAG